MDHYFSGAILKLIINTSKDHRYCLASKEEPIFQEHNYEENKYKKYLWPEYYHKR